MKWNDHSKIAGSHAFLGASKHGWLNDDAAKLKDRYIRWAAAQRGTEMHDLAAKLIKLGVELPQTTKTFDQYVNDAIGYRMRPEQTLYYSDNCFGTADAIAWDENLKILRIHDLKTGQVVPAKIEQLYIYAALFCLEYHQKPGNMGFVLRLYQNNKIVEDTPTADVILPIMDKIIQFDKLLNNIKGEL
jgi:hypothetical protein